MRLPHVHDALLRLVCLRLRAHAWIEYVFWPDEHRWDRPWHRLRICGRCGYAQVEGRTPHVYQTVSIRQVGKAHAELNPQRWIGTLQETSVL